MGLSPKIAGLFGGILIALAAGGLARIAAEEPKPPERFEGEILDLACYLAKGAKGEGHAKCAESCVKAGQPMGLLTIDGKVHVLFANHADGSAFEKAKTFAGKKVVLEGRAAARDGLSGVEVVAVRAP